jgi:hypothetical protein
MRYAGISGMHAGDLEAIGEEPREQEVLRCDEDVTSWLDC